MRINNIGPSNINPYKKQLDRLDNIKKQDKTDKVEISAAAKEMQAENKITAARNEKVEALKEQVRSGQYEVDANAVAKKMIEFYTQAK